MCQENRNQEGQENLADMMMSNIVQFGKFSYELEEKREQSLINQSNQMLTAFAIFSAALYMILPVIISANPTLTGKLLFCTGIISFLLIASLVLALLAQWRYKYSTMAGINEFYNRVNEEHQNYQTQAQFDMQWKDQLISIQTSKKKNNDKRAKLVIASAWLFLISIGSVIISVLALSLMIL